MFTRNMDGSRGVNTSIRYPQFIEKIKDTAGFYKTKPKEILTNNNVEVIWSIENNIQPAKFV